MMVCEVGLRGGWGLRGLSGRKHDAESFDQIPKSSRYISKMVTGYRMPTKQPV